MRKRQITVYLDPATMDALGTYAAHRDKPKSLVAEAAITSFLSPDATERQEAAMAKRLDRIGRVLDRLERNGGVALETLALFIRFWLTATPSRRSGIPCWQGGTMFRKSPLRLRRASRRLSILLAHFGAACPPARQPACTGRLLFQTGISLKILVS